MQQSALLNRYEAIGQPEYDSDKWPVPQDAYQMFFNDNRDTVCILELDGKVFLGYSKCGRRDVFNEGLGRTIALGRACKKYHQWKARRNGNTNV